MAQRGGDPYLVLGVRPDATDQEVRSAYRRLVQLHHPDHNSGSAESARRFEDVQDAYAQVRELRAHGTQPPRASSSPPPADPGLDARLADMERDLREAHLARERARKAAAAAAASQASQRKRPSDEELGYIKTDDSLGKIFSDAAAGLSEQLAELFDDARDELNRRRR
jgi:curved DNA-binding protein CbpA